MRVCSCPATGKNINMCISALKNVQTSTLHPPHPPTHPPSSPRPVTLLRQLQAQVDVLAPVKLLSAWQLVCSTIHNVSLQMLERAVEQMALLQSMVATAKVRSRRRGGCCNACPPPLQLRGPRLLMPHLDDSVCFAFAVVAAGCSSTPR